MTGATFGAREDAQMPHLAHVHGRAAWLSSAASLSSRRITPPSRPCASHACATTRSIAAAPGERQVLGRVGHVGRLAAHVPLQAHS